MKIGPYVNKLNDSSEFKGFQKEHKDAFVVAGFFVLDLESGKNVHQIDYYVPSKKKVAAFTLDRHVTMQMLDLLNAKTPEKLDLNTKVDLDQLYGILEDEMKNRSITEDIKKIIAIIQNIEGKKVWNLSCVLSGMGILNAHVDDDSRTVLKMEKKSLLDFMQRMSPEQFKEKIQQKPGAVNVAQGDVKEQIKKLDDLENAIKKEKEELEKKSSDKNSEVKLKVEKVRKK